MKTLSHSLAETEKIAGDFIREISAAGNDKATVIGLSGDLGSGKTTFTQALGKYLGVKEIMTSPTFVIQKRYDLDGKFGFKKLIHIDAYRLEGGKEILALNFGEDLADPQNLILIEWPERVSDALLADLRKIDFLFVSEGEREVSW